MPAWKLIPVVLIVAVLALCGLFFFVPGARPGFVQGWFDAARGYTPAKSADDALDKLRKAIEKRDYDAAKLYLTGPYLEQFEKGKGDAAKLAAEIEALRQVMADNGVKSDKVGMMLYWLDPFPAFKYKAGTPKEGAKSIDAVIHWDEDAGKFKDAATYSVNVDNKLRHALLPVGALVNLPLKVVVKEVEDGVWKVEIPVQFGDRHVRDCVQQMEKNASNVANAMGKTKDDLKRDKAIKADFESAFKANIEKATK